MFGAFFNLVIKTKTMEIVPNNERFKVGNGRNIGVEIEADNEGDNYDLEEVKKVCLENGLGVSRDGSLSSCGLEVKIPACGISQVKKLVEIATKLLARNGFYINSSCGLHIHLQYPCRKIKIKRLLLLVWLIEPLIFAINPKSRRNNSYCQSIAKDFTLTELIENNPFTIDELYYSKKDIWQYSDNRSGVMGRKMRVKRLKQEQFNPSRYYGLNLHSLFYRGTVEFRYHSGTLEVEKIMRWIEFLYCLINYALKNFNLEEITKIQELKPEEMVDYLRPKIRLSVKVADYLKERIEKFN
jgi:hypothetical protein